jgi:hypothetical protein
MVDDYNRFIVLDQNFTKKKVGQSMYKVEQKFE